MSDNDFLLKMLIGGAWTRLDMILAWSQQIRGHGLTVHSRAADLRKRGHIIETRQERNSMGRVDSYYRLVGSLAEAAAASPSLLPLGATAPAASASVPASNQTAHLDGAAEDSMASLDGAGTLSLFECVVDESAGLRGAYGNEAA